MKEGITVIIPCYNAEEYLEDCINSIINQTYKNIEIIIVDDKSKDNSKKIIEKYVKKHSNIKGIYNYKNHGAGYSRNKAVLISKYDYISFVDSDDYIEENYCEILMKKLKKEKANVAICDIYIRYNNDLMPDVRSCVWNDPDEKFDFINNGLAASPCNKLFIKKDLLKYPFAEGIMNEDIPAVMAILLAAKKVVYTEDTYYNYVQRDTSVQNSVLSDKRLDLFKAMDILEDRINKNKLDKSLWKVIVYQQIITFLLYVPAKEKSIIKRARFLKKFYHLSKKYKIRKNNLFWDFLGAQGKKHMIYYKLLFKLNDNGFSLLSSLLISFYRFYSKLIKKNVIKNNITLDDVIEVAKKQSKLKSKKKTLSVVLPNYNYENFMYQRIYSILNQKVKINELIILDDCSKDGSIKLLDELIKQISPYVNVIKKYNTKNCGPFKQWEKGFKLATSDYVWIAEADDYSDPNFLKEVFKPLYKDKDIIISYVDTAFVDKIGTITIPTIRREIDVLKTGHWNKSYINDGLDEIKNYSYLNCTIANVSSVIFKNGDYNEFFKLSGEYRQAGDWLFYINVMRHGKIAYSHKPLNYYREHGNNVTSNTKRQHFLDECLKVQEYINTFMKFDKTQKKNIEARVQFLKKVWRLK